MTHSIQLGHIDTKDLGNKEVIDGFVQSRAQRLNVDLQSYAIDIDPDTGCVTATWLGCMASYELDEAKNNND